MSATLAPCSSCHRHVRRTERACPFCGTLRVPDAGPSARVVSSRIGRAALFSLGAAAVTSTAGCGSKTQLFEPGPPPTAEHDAGWAIGAYGAPPLDASLLPMDVSLLDPDAGAPVTPDGGSVHELEAGADERDAGAILNLYGAPPIPEDDAGPDADLGCCNADYGGPPWP